MNSVNTIVKKFHGTVLKMCGFWTYCIIRPHRSTTYTDVAYCYWLSSMVCQSVGLSVTLVSPAITPEPIEMLFGVWAWVGPRNHVLDGVYILPWKGAIFKGEKGRAIVKHRDLRAWAVQKWLNRSRCRLACWVAREPCTGWGCKCSHGNGHC